jgi:hypothetical protein
VATSDQLKLYGVKLRAKTEVRVSTVNMEIITTDAFSTSE